MGGEWIQEKSEKWVVEWLDSEKPRYSLATRVKKRGNNGDRRVEGNENREN